MLHLLHTCAFFLLGTLHGPLPYSCFYPTVYRYIPVIHAERFNGGIICIVHVLPLVFVGRTLQDGLHSQNAGQPGEAHASLPANCTLRFLLVE